MLLQWSIDVRIKKRSRGWRTGGGRDGARGILASPPSAEEGEGRIQVTACRLLEAPPRQGGHKMRGSAQEQGTPPEDDRPAQKATKRQRLRRERTEATGVGKVDISLSFSLRRWSHCTFSFHNAV